MNKNIAKCMGQVKQSFTPFQFIRFLEKAQFIINERPISLSNTLEILCPNDVSSLHTKIKNTETLSEFIRKSDENVKLFTELWYDLYWSSLFSQRKWFQTDEVEIGSLVLILDTRNHFNYPSLGILREIEEGTTDDVQRYFMVEHRTKTDQTRVLRRPAQQLSLVLSKSEMDEDREEDASEDEDDEDYGPGDDPDAGLEHAPGDPHVHDDHADDVTLVTGDQGGGGSEDGGSLWDDHQLGPVQERRGNPWRFSPDDQTGKEDGTTHNVQNIVNVETDQESQHSTEDSDGDDNIEEKLDAGHPNAVEDNIKTNPTVKVTIPDKPDSIKNLKKRKKPRPKVQRK